MDERNRKSEGMDEDTKSAIGTGAGGLAGAAAGAALGTVVPGVGNVVGAVIGGAIGLVGGAAAGHAIAEHIDPKQEDDYWRNNYSSRPYAQNANYDDYGPAYRYGWETRGRYPVGQQFDEVEPHLRQDWDRSKGSSKLSWDNAKQASRDAWDRIERALPGDADKDGK